jgi:hypothetical protein
VAHQRWRIQSGRVNLQKVTIDGDLEIDVGTGGPGNAALQKLIAHSMGLSANVAPERAPSGTVDAVKIAHDKKESSMSKVVREVRRSTSSIGGDWRESRWSAGGAAAGLLRAAADRALSKGMSSAAPSRAGLGSAEAREQKIRGDLRTMRRGR